MAKMSILYFIVLTFAGVYFVPCDGGLNCEAVRKLFQSNDKPEPRKLEQPTEMGFQTLPYVKICKKNLEDEGIDRDKDAEVKEICATFYDRYGSKITNPLSNRDEVWNRSGCKTVDVNLMTGSGTSSDRARPIEKRTYTIGVCELSRDVTNGICISYSSLDNALLTWSRLPGSYSDDGTEVKPFCNALKAEITDFFPDWRITMKPSSSGNKTGCFSCKPSEGRTKMMKKFDF